MNAATAIDILTKACQFDAAGRRLEALGLYEDGIQILLDAARSEPNEAKKKHYQNKVKEYIERAEHIKVLIEKKSTKGEIIGRYIISEGATGHSYKTSFKKYMTNEVSEIEIDEPYMREHYQFINLIMFFELSIKKCKNLKYIKLTTTTDPKSPSDQGRNFGEITENLSQKGIKFQVIYSENLHDRQIILSNGYIFKIGRGLHYFKPQNRKYNLGINDYDFRPCLETNIDIFRCAQ